MVGSTVLGLVFLTVYHMVSNRPRMVQKTNLLIHTVPLKSYPLYQVSQRKKLLIFYPAMSLKTPIHSGLLRAVKEKIYFLKVGEFYG